MKKYTKKLIAPLLIILIVVLYYIFIGWVIVKLPLPMGIKFLALTIPLALICMSIYVLIQRIKEIRSGEEDDLSQY